MKVIFVLLIHMYLKWPNGYNGFLPIHTQRVTGRSGSQPAVRNPWQPVTWCSCTPTVRRGAQDRSGWAAARTGSSGREPQISSRCGSKISKIFTGCWSIQATEPVLQIAIQINSNLNWILVKFVYLYLYFLTFLQSLTAITEIPFVYW